MNVIEVTLADHDKAPLFCETPLAKLFYFEFLFGERNRTEASDAIWRQLNSNNYTSWRILYPEADNQSAEVNFSIDHEFSDTDAYIACNLALGVNFTDVKGWMSNPMKMWLICRWTDVIYLCPIELLRTDPCANYLDYWPAVVELAIRSRSFE